VPEAQFTRSRTRRRVAGGYRESRSATGARWQRSRIRERSELF